ncbi:hypothetical protein CK203_109782 [Vitis vinifera]|uniref:Uncharacterized protein n=1 Tax=Vitis vinifera TaxID=29760 RepID=A0A438EIW8_VITVI|nr:hypothetical protein CK203_109782 [Vitis vinifera]
MSTTTKLSKDAYGKYVDQKLYRMSRSQGATCPCMVGCWGTRVVFLMANQRSTRVQRICKKLQTVRGAGWPAAREVVWAAVGDFFFREGRESFQVGGYRDLLRGELLFSRFEAEGRKDSEKVSWRGERELRRGSLELAGGGGAVQKGKLVGFVDIGGGLKALTAKQSLTGKGFFQCQRLPGLVLGFVSRSTSLSPTTESKCNEKTEIKDVGTVESKLVATARRVGIFNLMAGGIGGGAFMIVHLHQPKIRGFWHEGNCSLSCSTKHFRKQIAELSRAIAFRADLHLYT